MPNRFEKSFRPFKSSLWPTGNQQELKIPANLSVKLQFSCNAVRSVNKCLTSSVTLFWHLTAGLDPPTVSPNTHIAALMCVSWKRLHSACFRAAYTSFGAEYLHNYNKNESTDEDLGPLVRKILVFENFQKFCVIKLRGNYDKYDKIR